ncbi:hypothetical protein BJ165DRAFT_1533689 [Panaeolus papilionaceus]|nr:hypothetical protein BJ165DRAFT_1533689 [Panaeolus papilionaceus]
MKATFVALVVVATIESALGHGYVASITTGGVTYPGWAPFTDPNGAFNRYLNPVPVRAERRITDNGPTTDVTSKACRLR